MRSQVVINEYSVSNRNTVLDNYGEHEDWIELYNTGASSADIGGYHLSDKPDNPLQWAIPAGVTIPSHGHLIIWASGRNVSGGGSYHTNFRLTQTKANPDWIVFSDPAGVILEQIPLENTQSDHSRGRTISGGD
jgi:hypothetical protein